MGPSAASRASIARSIERAVSPRNFLFTRDGRLKLIDLGALAAFGPTTEVVGTPPFLPPEALQKQGLDGRSDLYAVGLVLLEAITGQQACGGRDMVERAQATLRGEPRLRAEQLTTPLRNLLVRALQDDPEQRPVSAAAMQFELQQIWQQPESDSSTARLLAAELDCQELEPSLRWIGRNAWARICPYLPHKPWLPNTVSR